MSERRGVRAVIVGRLEPLVAGNGAGVDTSSMARDLPGGGEVGDGELAGGGGGAAVLFWGRDVLSGDPGVGSEILRRFSGAAPEYRAEA